MFLFSNCLKVTLENRLSVTLKMQKFVDGRWIHLVENIHGREFRVGTSCQTADHLLTTPLAQLQVHYGFFLALAY